MSRLVVGTPSSETVWAITGVTPTAATAIRPILVEKLVTLTLFGKHRHAPHQRIRPMLMPTPPSAPFGGMDRAVTLHGGRAGTRGRRLAPQGPNSHRDGTEGAAR